MQNVLEIFWRPNDFLIHFMAEIVHFQSLVQCSRVWRLAFLKLNQTPGYWLVRYTLANISVNRRPHISHKLLVLAVEWGGGSPPSPLEVVTLSHRVPLFRSPSHLLTQLLITLKPTHSAVLSESSSSSTSACVRYMTRTRMRVDT